MTATACDVCGGKHLRNINLRRTRTADRILKAGRHDADDFPRFFVQLQVLSDSIRSAAITTPPEPITDDDHVSAVFDFIGGFESTPHKGSNAQDRKELV